MKTYQNERYANKLAKEFVSKNLLAMIVVAVALSTASLVAFRARDLQV